MDLVAKYGTYKVNKGTRLYRRAKDTDYHEVMFFGFCHYATAGATYHSNIQVWETTEDFEALFMIKGQNRLKHPQSAIVDIYNSYFPGNIKNDWDFVNIKQTEVERTPLLNKLREDRIGNWVCSVENLLIMEVCLFESLIHNQQLTKFMYSVDEDERNTLVGHDSFDHGYLAKLNLEYVVVNNDPQFDLIHNLEALKSSPNDWTK